VNSVFLRKQLGITVSGMRSLVLVPANWRQVVQAPWRACCFPSSVLMDYNLKLVDFGYSVNLNSELQDA